MTEESNDNEEFEGFFGYNKILEDIMKEKRLQSMKEANEEIEIE